MGKLDAVKVVVDGGTKQERTTVFTPAEVLRLTSPITRVRRATNEGRKPPNLRLSVYPLAQRLQPFPQTGRRYL